MTERNANDVFKEWSNDMTDFPTTQKLMDLTYVGTREEQRRIVLKFRETPEAIEYFTAYAKLAANMYVEDYAIIENRAVIAANNVIEDMIASRKV